MTYQLYGDVGSGSATVELALAEIGAAATLHPVPLEAEAQTAEAYRAINPLGRVPTLVLPDGVVLTESVAILITLCERHPEAGLLPEPGTSDRATALRWMIAAASEFYPAVTRSDYPERFSADPAHAPAIRDAARQAGRAFWRTVECVARPDPFVLGERFSVADIYLSVLSRWMSSKEWLPTECPRVEGMARRVAARAACAPVWERHFPQR